MRILNVIASLDPVSGGPTMGTLALASALRCDGHIVEHATLDSPHAVYVAPIEGIHPLGTLGGRHDANSRRLRERFGYTPDMVPWLRAHVPQFDLILVHGLWNYSSVAAARVLPVSGVPYMVFPHGTLDPWFAASYPWKHRVKRLLWPLNEGRLMNAARRVLFTTVEESDLAPGQFRPWRIKPAVVGYGAQDVPPDAEHQVAAFRALLPAIGDDPFLLFLSRIHPKKGCDLLVRGFARIAAAHPRLKLVVAGPDQTGWSRQLQAMAAAYGVADRIYWPGMVSGAAKWGAFREAAAFVLPSHSENFGIVVAEALACATPVLITNKVNLWREVAEAGAGFVETDTQGGIDALLAGLMALDHSARQTMGRAARACYERHFCFSSTARRIVDLAVEESS